MVRVESTVENRAKRGVLINADDNTETALDTYVGWDIVVDNNSDYDSLVNKADEVINLFDKFLAN